MSNVKETVPPSYSNLPSSSGYEAKEPRYSSLQATAPEFRPLNANQGAIRKKSYRNSRPHNNHTLYQGHHESVYNGDGGRNFESAQSYEQQDGQVFHPTGGVKKKGVDKNRGGYSNWRSSHYNNNGGTYYAQNPNSKSRKHNTYEETEQPRSHRNDGRYGKNGNQNFSYDLSYEGNNYQQRNKYQQDSFYGNGASNKSHEQFRRTYRQSSNKERLSVPSQIVENHYHADKKLSLNKLSKRLTLSTAGQKERLTEMIDSNMLECLVCCEKIKRTDKVWSCSQCYHIIHLLCILAWVKSSKVEENWRCPACQNGYTEVPQQYTCYCGKIVDPKVNPNIIAHGCDNLCSRKGKNCEHKCNILCHPGPCPECNIMVPKFCGCGSTQQVVKCCSDIKVTCQSPCKKVLNCGLHICASTCHPGPCEPCSEFIIQECHCGKTGRKVNCDENNSGITTFTCENVCGKLLSCGLHNCQKQCHSGPCLLCETDITLIKHCYCSKVQLKTPRLTCLDPIPCCDNICGKTLICGPPSKPHTCKSRCHKGKCPPCSLTTVVKCRCGHMDKEIACQKVTRKADDARCEKKCVKKRLCGKHTCKQKCCIEIEHICPLPCNKMLSCGLHKCELTCHSGRCPPCIETSFEELYCECKASVLYPPVPCGTKPPSCDKPCSKKRVCGHPPNHDCHPGNCPSCFVLTKKWCHGRHESRGTIPCHQASFSCGLSCGKPMVCGRHKCVKQCHDGHCPVPCTQPCSTPRSLCGHPCNKPCHTPPCPESNCKQMVPVSCLCGLQKGQKMCTDLTEEYKAIEMAYVKDRMDNFSSSYQTIDFSEAPKKPSVMKILECNDECRILERNRRLAIGLQIQNPDLSQKLTPRYSVFLKQCVKKDPKFCQRIHDKLTELVQLAKQSKQKSRSYSFESMNRDKRHFIHEYCEYFGIESAAYDAEPNRNVVATATRDKSWLPGMSVLEVLQRESGQRKVPGPVLGYKSHNEGESVSLKLLTSVKNV
ncbi:protein shuttle craft [Euwallacea similis]|uniref:protein shuttle craft n=1 Tax=Euwallacea similis TaxID=1736056 RepID=UPI0034500969